MDGIKALNFGLAWMVIFFVPIFDAFANAEKSDETTSLQVESHTTDKSHATDRYGEFDDELTLRAARAMMMRSLEAEIKQDAKGAREPLELLLQRPPKPKEIAARRLLHNWLVDQPHRISGFSRSAGPSQRVTTWRSLKSFSSIFSQRVWAYYTNSVPHLEENLSFVRINIDRARGVKPKYVKQLFDNFLGYQGIEISDNVGSLMLVMTIDVQRAPALGARKAYTAKIEGVLRHVSASKSEVIARVLKQKTERRVTDQRAKQAAVARVVRQLVDSVVGAVREEALAQSQKLGDVEEDTNEFTTTSSFLEDFRRSSELLLRERQTETESVRR